MMAANFAEEYSKVSSYQYNKGIKLLGKLNIQTGQTVLDIGCGTGELSAYIAEKVGKDGKVLAIDPDKDRIDFAVKKYENIPNLTFREAGICEFPQEDVYDVIFSNSVFTYISDEDLKSSLSSIYECALKPGGVVGIQTAMLFPDPFLKTIQCFPAEIQEEIFSKMRQRDGEEYEKIFKAAGFKDIALEIFKGSRTFKDKDDLFSALFIFTQGLVDVRKALQEKVAAIDLKKTSSGEILFEASAIMLLAKK